MEKISGILPASPRVKAVDLKNSQPVRSGVPTFGRKVAGEGANDRMTVTTLEKMQIDERLQNYHPRDVNKEKIPVRLASQFFVGPKIEATDSKNANDFRIDRFVAEAEKELGPVGSYQGTESSLMASVEDPAAPPPKFERHI